MTPAIAVVGKAKIEYSLHEYEHRFSADSYGMGAAEALGVDPERVFKTLIAALDGQKDRLAVGIIPSARKLDLKAFADAAGAKKADMADPKDAERTTGYVVGGISPLGQRKKLPTFIDESVQRHDTIFVSAGKRGLQIELAPSDLLALTGAKLADIAR